MATKTKTTKTKTTRTKTAKKRERSFIEMLEKGETIH